METLIHGNSIFLILRTPLPIIADCANGAGSETWARPAKRLDFFDDAYFDYVSDLGNAGLDRGQGGKHLASFRLILAGVVRSMKICRFYHDHIPRCEVLP